MLHAMSIEKPLREMVKLELRVQMRPMNEALAVVEDRLEFLADLRNIVTRLEPLAARLNVKLPVVPRAAPVRKGPGRPKKVERPQKAAPVAPTPAPVEAEEPKAARGEEKRACAIIGCPRANRSKGYCSAHYQKLRLLVKTNRRPASWVDDAGPHSVPDVVLPRGRTAGREEAPAPPPEPKEPPKPKAWVRKKGGERISLH
jgi:histone H1/5